MVLAYGHADYAASLQDIGTPLRLEAGQGWVLRRDVPAGGWDAVGCYPLTRCARWSGLPDDAAALRAAGAVSLTLVADPLAPDAPAAVRAACPDVARPFKDHFVTDLNGVAPFGDAHHRRHVRRFARAGEVETVADPSAHLDAWCRLYDGLIVRHRILGAARFSRAAFARQLALPGVRLLRAVMGGITVGYQLWFLDHDRQDYHLAAYAEAGYRAGASHALMARALELGRAEGRAVALLGSGAGLRHDARDGLTRWKAGWATGTRQAWLGGAVLDRAAYAVAVARTGTEASGYFPAYRDPHPLQEPVHAH
ncbi:MAG TPA: GNAT family N-acetyltransferase [Candidatus Krumholzibacteria bacterium]|nr:GNAT family N-acetyltransferase [Candidatus Krumholzibacteria bacterium]